MVDDTAVIRQELANISGQLVEMQATMIRWMSQQADTALEQQKKTSPLPTKYAVWPYEWRRSRPDYHQPTENQNAPNHRRATSGRKRGL